MFSDDGSLNEVGLNSCAQENSVIFQKFYLDIFIVLNHFKQLRLAIWTLRALFDYQLTKSWQFRLNELKHGHQLILEKCSKFLDDDSDEFTSLLTLIEVIVNHLVDILDELVWRDNRKQVEVTCQDQEDSL